MAQPKAITVEGNGSSAPEGQRSLGGGLSLGCDQPIEQSGFVAHNELLLSGWAISPNGISGVVLQIGDRTLNATYGLDTPWVAEDMPEIAGADRAGFELRIDTSDWQAGEQEVRVVAFDQDGDRAELAGRVKVLPYDEPRHAHAEIPAAIAAGEVVMWLESPPIVEGPCEVEGRLEVRGWAYAKDGLDAVRVLIDGQAFEALHPIVRPDLLEDFGPDVAAGAGFVLPIHPSECPPGGHRLSVVAVGRDGRGVGVGGEIVVLPEPAAEPPQPGEPAAVEWIEDRRAPVRRTDATERYDPEASRGSALEIEHQLRYRWALELAPGRVVLDAGCGSGWGAALLAGAGAERVVGIDASEEVLADARHRTEGQPVEYHCCDPCLLPFDDDSFDLITCFEAIERSEDPDLALEEMRRVLRPEGVLLVSTTRRRPAPDGSGRDAWGHTGGELELALRRDFANVRLHRQRICLGSTIVEDEVPAGGGNASPEVGASKVDLRGLDAGSGGEARVVMIASTGPLPEPSRVAALGSPRAIRRLHDSARTWEDRALRAEAEAAATRVQLNLARMQQEASAGMLRERTAELALQEGTRERLEEQEGRLIEQQGRLEEQDARIWAQYEQIEQQREQLAQREALLDSQAGALGARNAELRITGERLRRAEEEAATWRESASVRVTRPLRAIGNGARRIRGSLARRRR